MKDFVKCDWCNRLRTPSGGEARYFYDGEAMYELFQCTGCKRKEDEEFSARIVEGIRAIKSQAGGQA